MPVLNNCTKDNSKQAQNVFKTPSGGMFGPHERLYHSQMNQSTLTMFLLKTILIIPTRATPTSPTMSNTITTQCMHYLLLSLLVYIFRGILFSLMTKNPLEQVPSRLSQTTNPIIRMMWFPSSFLCLDFFDSR